MTQTDFMVGFMIVVMGLILGQLLKEVTEDYREWKRIKRDWEAMKRKDLPNE